jgi:1-acyl-sn-glycerol-3-phosphate acyltransferase
MAAAADFGMLAPHRRRPAFVGPFELVCAAVLQAWCPLTVSGREQIPAGPFILCSNHQSHLDSVALMHAAGGRFGDFGLLAAEDYFFDRPLTSRLVSPVLHLIPVARSTDARSLPRTLSHCRRFVSERGGNLIIYPEGGRARDGRMRPFKRGVALIAAELGLPIVPAYVKGTSAVMPPGARWPRRGPIHVRFGPPVTYRQAGAGEGARRAFHEAAADLERRVSELKASSGD